MRRRLCLIIILALAFFLPPFAVRAEDKPLQLYEQKIKAGLVYNFLKYTTWPQSGTGTLNVCLFGGDPFDGYLSPLEGRTAQQSVIDINIVRSVEGTADCNVVIIAKKQAGSLPELLRFLEGRHVLTISDISQFARNGGMVELTKEKEKINLYVNKDVLNQAGLEIQAQMLKLAKLVSG